MTRFPENSESKPRSPYRLAASHQRSWLWGRYAVTETLRSGRWPVTQLLLSEDLAESELQKVALMAAAWRIGIQRVPAKRISELCRSEDHQGFLAQMAEFPYETEADLTSLISTKDSGNSEFPLLLLICDRIQDAHNFGAILRTADAMGVSGVIIGPRDQVQITPHVSRASSGAVNFMRVFRVSDLGAVIATLKNSDVRVAGATEKSDRICWASSVTGPVALVVGSEAKGLSTEILNQCDLLLKIPMMGQGESLNAGVAAGILMYEIRRQQLSHSGQEIQRGQENQRREQ